MKKVSLISFLFCLIINIYGQSVSFVRNGQVIADGATIKVTEVNGPEMSPEVLVRNSSGEEVVTVLKITTVKNGEVGFCGYCGFGSELCVAVGEGQSVSRGVILPTGETIDPAIHWQGIRGENPIVDAVVKYELKTGGVLEPNRMGTMDVVDEGNTVSTITVRFLYGDVPGMQNQFINWEQSMPTMIVGDKLKLNATSTSNLPITYTSSDPSKVEITENDTLHALTFTGEGYVTITASQVGNDYYMPATPVQQYVKVKKAKAGIRLSDCVQTYDGELKQVTVAIIPEGVPYTMKYYQGTYETTDTKNADVYYVEVIVNTNAYEASANTWLIVNKAPQIIVWNQEQTLEEGEEMMLTASNSFSQDIEYYSESPSIADIEVREGRTYLLGRSKGTVRIMARVNGDHNHEEGVEVRTFTVKAPVGIHEITANISCYPTQVTDYLYVEGAKVGDNIVLTNMAGNEVLALTVVDSIEKIDFANVSSGVYLLKVICNDKSFTYKVVKK